jgi:TRAP-type C4-dicarboxylate transport system substrate-binding protein
VSDLGPGEKTSTGANNTRRNLLVSLAGVGLSAPFLAGRRLSLDEPITLRYSAHVPRSHGFYTDAYLPFAELVERESQGRMRLEAYTDRLLHGPIDGFKAAVTGITDYTHAYVTYQPGSFKLLHAPQLPFLFPSPQVASLVFEELYPQYFKAEYERMGVYYAHCDCTSPYNIISKTPIRRLEDLSGLKVRVTGGITAEIFRSLGAIPVAIAAAEIYPAFQRGIIDAVTLAVPDIVSYRLYEIGPFYTQANVNLIVLQYCLNRQTLDSLPEDLRHLFYRLLRVRSQIAVQNVYSGPGHERAMNILRQAGTEMIELDQAERLRWRDAVTPLKERYIAQYEAEGLPARAVINDMELLSAEYATLTNAEINDRVRNSPIQGIIDL